MTQMFDYKFKKISAKSGFFKFSYDKDYKKIIQEHAHQGWRFIQLVPTVWDGHGRTKEIDLIFERPADWEEQNSLYGERTV